MLEKAIATYQDSGGGAAGDRDDQLAWEMQGKHHIWETGPRFRAAIAAYNMLTGEQQALVTNYELTGRRRLLSTMLWPPSRQVTMLIDRIGAVSQASGGQIAEARAAYNSLTPDQQRRVTNWMRCLN